jgi:hypothetical protein
VGDAENRDLFLILSDVYLNLLTLGVDRRGQNMKLF